MSVIRADARALPLVDGCVDCVVTSPPYFGLRDYGNPQQIGLETTAEAYTAAMAGVFREVRRVLKDGGTCWLNLGDSYASMLRSGRDESPGVGATQAMPAVRTAVKWKAGGGNKFAWTLPGGQKPKDLMGIPWRVAFALQADGWYLRSDIIWSKPNPMPESVTDRPTKAHEYLFLLTKSERYHYDADAICELASDAMIAQMEQGYMGEATKDYASVGVQNPSSVKARIIAGKQRRQGFTSRRAEGGMAASGNEGKSYGEQDFRKPTRNRRTVWTIPTMPYAGAHFATMPEKLVEPCILAGCPAGGLVLDPFCGSGTVIAVAERLGRRAVGTDLSYQDLAKKRTAQRGLMFAERA